MFYCVYGQMSEIKDYYYYYYKTILSAYPNAPAYVSPT